MELGQPEGTEDLCTQLSRIMSDKCRHLDRYNWTDLGADRQLTSQRACVARKKMQRWKKKWVLKKNSDCDSTQITVTIWPLVILPVSVLWYSVHQGKWLCPTKTWESMVDDSFSRMILASTFITTGLDLIRCQRIRHSLWTNTKSTFANTCHRNNEMNCIDN